MIGRVLLLLLLLVTPAHAKTPPLVSQGTRVWVIGDSNGWLLMHELPKLARRDGVVLRGNPVGGTSIMWWNQRAHQRHINQVVAFKPDVLLIVLGTNDAHFGSHVRKTFSRHLDQLLPKLGKSGARLVWVGPPKLPRRPERGADEVRKMVTERDILLLDSRQCVMPMWEDKIHPSFKGRKMWADWIWGKLTATP